MNVSKLVVLSEGNPDEVFLFLRAVQKVGIQNPVRVLSDTRELKSYLLAEVPYQDRRLFPFPALVFLDLDDRAGTPEPFLKWLRSESPCPNLLVVGLSDIERPANIQRLFDLGMNAFFVKRLNPVETVSMIKNLDFLDDILETRRDVAV